ncbi:MULTISPECIES: HNH endonuclease [Providencia]|uniref:HNH endonuclease n=1 Tax=Providencia TaxID=586 RepID=UPI0016505CDB|nr:MULTISPECIES: HNH endonuclease [Providencia]ELR5214526.1 HNH endonuclease [Providencia rettgeri]HEM6865383.1 HNH endonuclease [Providencia rettgeri]
MEQSELKKLMVYSPKSGVFTWVNPPRVHFSLLGEEAGYPSNDKKKYWIIQVNGKKFKRSHLAFLFMNGEFPKGVVDHINGNSLDDRWINLRDTTQIVNNQNRRVGKQGRTLPMGVKQLKSGKYMARIGANGKSISLGTFSSICEAESAYLAGKEKYHEAAII